MFKHDFKNIIMLLIKLNWFSGFEMIRSRSVRPLFMVLGSIDADSLAGDCLHVDIVKREWYTYVHMLFML